MTEEAFMQIALSDLIAGLGEVASYDDEERASLLELWLGLISDGMSALSIDWNWVGEAVQSRFDHKNGQQGLTEIGS